MLLIGNDVENGQKERKRNGLPCPRHKTMDYEDKE